MVKNLPASAGDAGNIGLIPGSGRSPGEGNGIPLQCSCLGNPTDRGAWQKSLGVRKRVEHDFKTKATTTIDKETEAQKMYTCGRFVLMFGKTNTVFQV